MLRMCPGQAQLESKQPSDKSEKESFQANANFDNLGKFHMIIRIGSLNTFFNFDFDGAEISNDQFFRNGKLTRTEDGQLIVEGLLRLGDSEFKLVARFSLDSKRKAIWESIALQ